MSDPEVLAVLRQWLRYAGEDLRTAEMLREASGIPRISCFHAQQAAEKSIRHGHPCTLVVGVSVGPCATRPAGL